MINHMNFQNEKKLKHVRVYDRLYQLIQDGFYPPGSQLPSEPDLAEQLHVSRMTLRRALALLQEDHLVKNIRGKGNFIRIDSSSSTSHGMELMKHPVYNCSTYNFDNIEIAFRIEPPTESISQSLGQKSAAVVIADRWFHCNGNAVAYTLSFLPIEVISEQQIDLTHIDELKKYLESDVYENAVNSLCKISFTKTGNFTSDKYMISQSAAFLLIHENIYDSNHRILVSNKHYITAESFELNINSRKPDINKEVTYNKTIKHE